MIAVAYTESKPECREADSASLSHRYVEAIRLTEALLPHERLYVDMRANVLIDSLRKILSVTHGDYSSHQVDQRIAYDVATFRINLGRELLQRRPKTTITS